MLIWNFPNCQNIREWFSCNSSRVGIDFLHSFMPELPQPLCQNGLQALVASPLVLINNSNTPAEAIQTWMSAGNLYPHSSCCRKVPYLHKYICDNYLVQKYKLTFFQAVEVRKVCQKPNRICTQKPYNGFFFSHQSKKSGLFVTISLACCWRKNGSFVIWSELHFFFFRASAITVSQ